MRHALCYFLFSGTNGKNFTKKEVRYVLGFNPQKLLQASGEEVMESVSADDFYIRRLKELVELKKRAKTIPFYLITKVLPI